MAEGQADREVLFRLKAVADDGNESVFAGFAQNFLTLQEQMHQAAAEAAGAGAELQRDAYLGAFTTITQGAQRVLGELRTIADAAAQAMAQVTGTRAAAMAGPASPQPGRNGAASTAAVAATAATTPATSTDAMQATADAQRAAYESVAEAAQQSAATQRNASQSVAAATGAQTTATNAATAAEKALEKEAVKVKASIRTAQEAYNDRLADLYNLYDKGKLTAEEYGTAAEQAHRKAEAAVAKEAATAEKAAKLAERDREKTARDIERVQKQAETAAEQSRGHAMRMNTAFIEAGQGVLQVAKGFGELGILSEKTTEGMVRGFIKVQAGYDVLRGGFEVWKKMTEAADAYRKMTQAATTAEVALAAARKATAATNAAQTVATAGTNAVGAATIGAGGAARLATASAPAALWAAAGVSIAAAFVSAIATGREALKHGAGSGATQGSLVDTVGGSDWNPASWWVAARQKAERDQAERRTERMTEQRTGIVDRLDLARQQAIGDERIRAAEQEISGRRQTEGRAQTFADASRAAQNAVGNAYRDKQEDLYRLRPGADTTEEQRAKYGMDVRRAGEAYQTTRDQIDVSAKQAVAGGNYDQAKTEADAASQRLKDLEARQQALASGQIGGRQMTGAELAGGAGAQERVRIEEQIKAAQEQQVAAQQKMAEASRERLAVEQEVGRVRLEAAERGIQFTKDEIALREQLIEREKGKVRSAQERLAGMNDEEFARFQQQIKDIRGKQATGEELTAEEFKFAQGLRDYKEFDDITRRAAETTGERRRAALGLGATEVANVDRLGEEKKNLQEQLNVQLKDERELRVNIQRDDDKLARQVAREIAQTLADRDKQLIDRIRRETQEELARLRQTLNEQGYVRSRAAQQRQSLG